MGVRSLNALRHEPPRPCMLREERVDQCIARAVSAAGYARVAVDLRGFRSGSLNVLAGVGAA